MVPVTHSGIKTREYLEWLVAHRMEQGFFHSPALCGHGGKEIGSVIYKGLILEALLEHQGWEALQGSQVPKLLECIDIEERYGLTRGVPQLGRKMLLWEKLMSTELGQWRSVELTQGRQVGGSM
jgi:hypothetical protein